MDTATVTDRNQSTTNMATNAIDTLNIMITADILVVIAMHSMPTHIIVGTKGNILDTDIAIETQILAAIS